MTSTTEEHRAPEPERNVSEPPPAERLEQPEVVETPSAELAVPEQPSALERAAEAALAMPGVPGRDEFLSLAMQARVLSLSGLAPKALRNNPHACFHIAMIGRDLGISPTAAMELIDVIGEGDKAQASLSPQLLLGQIRRLGLGAIRPLELTDDHATVGVYGPKGEWWGQAEFSWEDARTAGLVDSRCEKPREHWHSSSQKCGCRMGWRNYPKRMLWWRAAGYAADDYFPEAGLGLYSPEELGAVVDEDGRPIDPRDVELPSGYEPAQKPPEPEASPDTVAVFKARIEALRAMPGAIEFLAEQWKAKEINRLETDPEKPQTLLYRECRMVAALLDMVEKKAAGGDFGDAQETAPAASPEVAAEAAEHERVAALDAADEAPEADAEELDALVEHRTPSLDQLVAAGGGPEEAPQHFRLVEDDAPPSLEEARAERLALVAELGFDPDALLQEAPGRTPAEDAVWQMAAPAPLAEAVEKEVHEMFRDELDRRLKAVGIPRAGGEEVRRRKLVARLVRRRMEQLADLPSI